MNKIYQPNNDSLENGLRTKTNNYQDKYILVAGTRMCKGDIWKLFQTISLVTQERANRLMIHFLDMCSSYSSKRGSLPIFWYDCTLTIRAMQMNELFVITKSQ
jgi:hypothetical protein